MKISETVDEYNKFKNSHSQIENPEYTKTGVKYNQRTC